LKIKLFFSLILASLLAASGQIFFKIGANNVKKIIDFLNIKICSGLLCYALSTIIWIYALSSARLITVYVFTALTFILVYLLAYFILNESISKYGLIGIFFVLLGIYLICIKG